MVPKPIDALEYELQAERAASLARVAARMEAAVTALRDYQGPPGPGRDALFAEAAEWVWCYVVQREALGWRDHAEALRTYQVPGAVIARMGPRPKR
jgi:hypothetical protein